MFRFVKVLFLILLLIAVNNIYADNLSNAEIHNESGLEKKIKRILRDHNAFTYDTDDEHIQLIFDNKPISEANIQEIKLQNINKLSKKFVFEVDDNDKKYSLIGKYEENSLVPMLKMQLSSGEIITEDDIEFHQININKLKRSIVKNADQLIGKTPRHLITENRPIQQNELSEPVLIKKGESITVSYNNNALTIRVIGIALEDGILNRVIKIRNPKTNTIIHAVITGKSTANIAL